MKETPKYIPGDLVCLRSAAEVCLCVLYPRSEGALYEPEIAAGEGEYCLGWMDDEHHYQQAVIPEDALAPF